MWSPKWIVVSATPAVLLLAGVAGTWAFLDRLRPAREAECGLPPYDVVATSRWEDVRLAATSRPYAKYFTPEALAIQAKRLDPALDVDKLHPATIRTPDGAMGTLFLDNAGTVVLATSYPQADCFSEGLAVVATRVNPGRSRTLSHYGYIDRTGRLTIDANYQLAMPFHEGLAAVQQGGHWGYIDREGRVVIPCRDQTATDFREGVARVSPGYDATQFIDRSGRVLYTTDPWSISLYSGGFSEGLLFVIDPARPKTGQARTWGYMDHRFEFAIRLPGEQFGRCEEFHEGLAAVQVSRDQPLHWGYLSRDGKVAIPGPYRDATAFSEGLAAVSIDAGEKVPRWGYIDRAGGMVIEPHFLGASRFSEGLAAVLVPLEPNAAVPTDKRMPCRWGYIDRWGQLVIGADYSRAEPFENGLAHVEVNPLIDGYIDHDGRFVWKLDEAKPEP